ncbi:MAG: spore maturation protein [Lachnospiraceae bacterium]|nr:spore maturation protein [Lachnospiraceae bacterium]MDY3818993.1 spore maturation protein [Lachnospiraceae bacterium]
MTFLLFFSNAIIPIILFLIVGYGLLSHCNIYDCFIRGAKRGLKIVLDILPTLVGLLLAVGILRASGFLDFVSTVLSPLRAFLSMPGELLSLAIVKLFSSSAATGLALDIFKQYGTDSYEGLGASLMLSCTESVFYTMSIYLLSVNIKKSRWILPAALISTFSGIAVSLFLAGLMTG